MINIFFFEFKEFLFPQEKKMSCPICADPYTSSIRKKTECAHCGYEFCVGCIKKYLLSHQNDPCCMNCKHEWNREFIDLHLSKNFRIKDYKKHRENVLLEREKLFFQETLLLMDKNKEQKKYCMEQINARQEEKKALQRKIYELNQVLHTFRYNFNLLENSPTRVIQDFQHSVEKKEYIRRCIQEDCKGYINNKGSCCLCKLLLCMKCHEEKVDGHECKQENVESVSQIRKETKSCPKCTAPIFKIDGCRQMWCTQCHTAFDWRTGQIIHHRIHNPHFYEWQKSQDSSGGGAYGAPCNDNELPPLSRIRLHVQTTGIDYYFKKKIFDTHRGILHLSEIEIPRVRTDPQDDLFQRNLDSRILFLHSRISEDIFKGLLTSRENKMERNKSLCLLLEMVCSTMIGFFHEFLTLPKTQIEHHFFEKLESLRQYANIHLENHCKRFSVRRMNFREDMFLERI